MTNNKKIRWPNESNTEEESFELQTTIEQEEDFDLDKETSFDEDEELQNIVELFCDFIRYLDDDPWDDDVKEKDLKEDMNEE
ncbi:MAG: hypothetical protein EZS28_022754 [Streblomastix strix]|uniref:Uncharacterized protein n=1 Tax=Streblomastix strix TaxID=222440 RepID=A0A5J4VGJ4_9EUKA|nr:MAG: hypothetical protein EZS28_022754 [Streblomastix strix]